MSKVPYTIDVDRYVCSELEILRKSYDTRDFSTFPAVIERIQFHVNAMEEGLWKYNSLVRELESIFDNKDSYDKAENAVREFLKLKHGISHG